MPGRKTFTWPPSSYPGGSSNPEVITPSSMPVVGSGMS